MSLDEEHPTGLAGGSPRALGSGLESAALADIRVVDLTQFESGTSCTLMLAWMGAEVIKVEQPIKGEQGRGANGTSTIYFSLLNANKKSVTCNLKTEGGRQVLRKLLESADVFVENFAPGVIERLGFGYEVVREINPKIVYAQIKGFAVGTPFEQFRCYDNVAQAMGGIMSVTGFVGQPPVRAGVTVGDTGSGLHLCIGILSALHQRDRTGSGQLVSLSMWETMINMVRMSYRAQAATGKAAPRKDNVDPRTGPAPGGLFPCKGGGPNDYVYLHATRARDEQWSRVAAAIERPELATDPRFATVEARKLHRNELNDLFTQWALQHDKWEVTWRLQQVGLPAGPVLDTMELSSDETLRERGMFHTWIDPGEGEFEMVGNPIRLSDSPLAIQPAPHLGAHNDEIYSQLGLTKHDLSQLKSEGAI
jgi:formyl-CoA transferase